MVVTGYSLEERRPFFFKSARARDDPRDDHPAWVVARATAAAPSYFEPQPVETEGGEVGVVAGAK